MSVMVFSDAFGNSQSHAKSLRTLDTTNPIKLRE